MDVSEELNMFFLIWTGTTFIFILTISIVIFIFFYQKKLYKQQQAINAIVLKHQEDLLYANWMVIENERKRLSRDLHDEIGSIFSTLSLTLGSFDKLQTGENSPHFTRTLSQSQNLIRTGVENMRRILQDITPPDLEIFGLGNTVLALVGKINMSGELHIQYDEEGEMPALINKHKELALYRIVQELINNTVKHAGATEAFITFKWTDKLLSLHYEDNGKGIEQPTGKEAGLGIKNIEGRVKMLKGTASFASKKENGMSFTFESTVENLAHE